MRNILAIAGIFAFLHGTQAQKVNSNSADLQFDALNKADQSVTITAFAGRDQVGTLELTGTGNGSTDWNLDLSGMGCTMATMNLYAGEKLVRSVPVRSGPMPYDIDITERERLMHSATVSADDELWPLLIFVVLCCGNATVGSGGWSVGWDCDCLSGISVGGGVDAGGTTYEDITRVSFMPLNGNVEQISKVDNLVVSSRGTRVTMGK